MPLFILLIGAILVTVAIKGSQGTLFEALKEDVPAFGVWAAAILALGVIGFVPGLKPVSRGLLALVIIVIIVNNYSKIMAGLKQGFTPEGGDAKPASNALDISHGVSLGQVFGTVHQGVSLAEQFGTGG
jgi:hypothetical protein